ncbi:Sau3AI family type II restriction endonuclease [Apilactobacillus apinorum]|uniref:Sau3AI family type II restriction endonuclease n=1 Tax=Apilactobacillus apinorum TaxID=1218495 RepID=A0ABP9ZHS5_9LACO
MGDVFEAWFGKTKDSSSKPDLGVSELKATPFKRLKNGDISAKERLVLNIINYEELDNENFESSHLLQKNKILELGYYEYNKEVPKSDWFFAKCVMYEMLKNTNDLEIIKKDWETIQSYVKQGKAEEINEGLTNYLAACTKGVNKHSMRTQPNSSVMAKQRAFSLKGSFMTTLLRDYIFGDQKSDAIVKDSTELSKKSLEEIIETKFNRFIGKSVPEIINELNIPIKESIRTGKYNVEITNKILGIKSRRGIEADEFKKASIVPKTIQFNSKSINKESMSLPPFKFTELVKESWTDKSGTPDASLNTYLSETKFLFIVFKEDDNGTNYLKGIKFFRIPDAQINGTIKDVWQETVNTLLSGVKLKMENGKVTNNFISSRDKKIIHIRPHAAKSSYIDSKDSNKLPTPAKWTNKPTEYNDNFMTTQSFWINSRYIKSVVKDLL